MKVFYPVNTIAIMEARLYANESIEYTADFAGWKDKYKKKQRLIIGNFVQYWVYEFCRLNKIQYQVDETTPYENDKFDIKVYGKIMDVKASVHENFVGQVTEEALNKDIDFFSFFLTDANCSFIAPYGVIGKEQYRQLSVKLQEGDTIPGTKIKNKFNVTNFIETIHLIPFVKFMFVDIKGLK